MNPRRRLIFIALLSVSLLCLVWLSLGPSEPTYQGKPFSVWVVDLDDQHPGPKNDQAEEAVRQIGAKALPQIIGMLNTRSDAVPDKIVKWAIAHHLSNRTYTEPSVKQHRAVLCCFTLGLKAKPAIPALIDLMNSSATNPIIQHYIRTALTQIGPDAVIPLIRELANPDDDIRCEAVHTLADFPTNAPLIVPQLIRTLKDKSPNVRAWAAVSLGHLAAEPATVVPALMTNLSDSVPEARWCACAALGKFRREAEPAVPPLQILLQDPSVEVRETAAVALAEIKPDDAITINLVIPVLIQDIEDNGGTISFDFQEAVHALAECGQLAKPAVPALLKCLKNSDADVQKIAADALKKIDPAAATEAGVK